MIRFANENDLKEINKIRKQVFLMHAKAHPEIFKSKWVEKSQMEYLKTYLTDENFYLYVAEENGTIMGYSMIEKKVKEETDFAHARSFYLMYDIGVAKNFRRQKVGTKILNQIKEDAKKNNVEAIELNVWDFNEYAEEFYEVNGFKVFRKYMRYDV